MAERDFEREQRQVAALADVIEELGPWLAPEWNILPRVGRTREDEEHINAGQIDYNYSHRTAIITQHPFLPEALWRRNAIHEVLHLAMVELERAVVQPLQAQLTTRAYGFVNAAYVAYEDELIERLVRGFERRHHPDVLNTLMAGGEGGLPEIDEEDERYTYYDEHARAREDDGFLSQLLRVPPLPEAGSTLRVPRYSNLTPGQFVEATPADVGSGDARPPGPS